MKTNFWHFEKWIENRLEIHKLIILFGTLIVSFFLLLYLLFPWLYSQTAQIINCRNPIAQAAITSGIVASLGIVLSLTFVYLQMRHNMLLHMSNYLNELLVCYNSKDMEIARAEMASAILAYHGILPENTEEQLDVYDLDDVLQFFEMIAVLEKKGGLDFHLLWNQFSIEMLHYYNALTSTPTHRQISFLEHLIAKAHDIYGNDDLYTEFKNICERMKKYNISKSIDTINDISYSLNFMKHEIRRNNRCLKNK